MNAIFTTTNGKQFYVKDFRHLYVTIKDDSKFEDLTNVLRDFFSTVAEVCYQMPDTSMAGKTLKDGKWVYDTIFTEFVLLNGGVNKTIAEIQDDIRSYLHSKGLITLNVEVQKLTH